jgi:hypothetical protein
VETAAGEEAFCVKPRARAAPSSSSSSGAVSRERESRNQNHHPPFKNTQHHQAGLLLSNGVAILNNERFLEKCE